MKIFFRNDDVNTLDDDLIELYQIFSSEDVPITMAVEPANVKQDTVAWLLDEKKANPDLMSIIQHGYDHQDRIPGKGEFGGRSYAEQYPDIKKGKELMNNYFGSTFFPAFTCPRHFHNLATIKCMDDLDFKVFSSGHGLSYKHKVLYSVGRAFRKPHLLGRHISYHMNQIPGTKLWEFSMSISPISKYYGMEDCQFAEIAALKKQIQVAVHQMEAVGITLHHRYHQTSQNKDLLKQLISYLKEIGCLFCTIEQLYTDYAL